MEENINNLPTEEELLKVAGTGIYIRNEMPTEIEPVKPQCLPRKSKHISSKIFTERELEIINKRLLNNKLDKTGHYSQNIKPKLLEIKNVWVKRIKEIEEFI